MFKKRSQKPERIDTGDYTAEEYDLFLEDIRLVNRFAGDNRALSKTLLRAIESENLQKFSILDVGAGSGELLRTVAKFAHKQNRRAKLFGLELNERSASAILEESESFAEIKAIRGDALKLPFADDTFDYVISSLFTHHLKDREIIRTLSEMSRVSRRKIFVIDLHRHAIAYAFYKVFCVTFNISQMVREDRSLSILKGFKPPELKDLAEKANIENATVKRHFPFRLVLKSR